MDILNSLVSFERLRDFVEKYEGQKGVARIVQKLGMCDDMCLVFLKNEHRYHHLEISSSQILELSHTVPGLQYRAPGFENEPLHYHSDRVKAYVMTHGYYVWGSGNDFAEWVCFVRADELDDTATHYSVPQDTIDMFLRKPRCMTHGYKGARTGRTSAKMPFVPPGSEANKDSDQ
jgi:hypothetical protein